LKKDVSAHFILYAVYSTQSIVIVTGFFFASFNISFHNLKDDSQIATQFLTTFHASFISEILNNVFHIILVLFISQ
jgi:hypothetical protein